VRADVQSCAKEPLALDNSQHGVRVGEAGLGRDLVYVNGAIRCERDQLHRACWAPWEWNDVRRESGRDWCSVPTTTFWDKGCCFAPPRPSQSFLFQLKAQGIRVGGAGPLV
jgi:hypothetical protein